MKKEIATGEKHFEERKKWFEDTVDKFRNAGIEEAVDIGFGEVRDEASYLGGREASYLDLREGSGFSCNVVGEKAEERLSYIVGVGDRVGERAGEFKAGPPEVGVGVGATHPVLTVCYAVCLAE